MPIGTSVCRRAPAILISLGFFWVDTGSREDFDAIRKMLQARGIEFTDLALIVHTHVHSDQVGSSNTGENNTRPSCSGRIKRVLPRPG